MATERPLLVKSRGEVAERIRRQIATGQDLQLRTLEDLAAIARFEDDHRIWRDANLELLRRSFSTDEERDRYAQHIVFHRTPEGGTELLAPLDLGDLRNWIRFQVNHLEALLGRLPDIDEAAPTPPPMIELAGLEIVENPRVRELIALDYREAQLALTAGAPKAAAILAASALEGVFLDALQRPAVQARTNYEEATRRLRHGGQSIVWNRASVVDLVEAAAAVGLLNESASHFGRGIADFRDTVHPQNEVARGRRARAEEARLLLELLTLVLREIAEALDT